MRQDGNRGNAAALKRQDAISTRVSELIAEREAAHGQAVTDAAERAGVTKFWLFTELRRLYERATQAVPVLDSKGKPTGEWKFDGATAARVLDLVGRHHGAWTPPVEDGDYANSRLARYIRSKERMTAFGPDGQPKITLEQVREIIAQADGGNGHDTDADDAPTILIGDS